MLTLQPQLCVGKVRSGREWLSVIEGRLGREERRWLLTSFTIPSCTFRMALQRRVVAVGDEESKVGSQPHSTSRQEQSSPLSKTSFLQHKII